MYFGLHASQEGNSWLFQRCVGDTGQRIIVISRLTTIDVPVRKRSGMGFCSRRNCIEKYTQPILRIDMAEVTAVGTQLSKQRLVGRRHSLSNDTDPEPWYTRRLRWSCRTQTIRICDRGGSKRIKLMCGPEMCRELLHKLSWRIDPVRALQFT